MNELQKKIYDYFDRDTELRVLFIFQDSVDMFTTAELESVEWKSGYRYIDFKGDWFTTKYRLDNDWQTASGKYFKTSAETAFRFFSEALDFEEAHTAIDDAEIESILFAEICKRTKKKFEMGIIYFPFRELGTVEDFILNVRGEF